MNITIFVRFKDDATGSIRPTLFRNVTQFMFVDDSLEIWMNMNGHIGYKLIEQSDITLITVYL